MINGSKAFITNSGTDITGLVTITAVTGEEENGHKEISAIIVPTGTPGFEVGRPYRKIGWHASRHARTDLPGLPGARGNLLGERGRGFANFLGRSTTAGSPSPRSASGWPRGVSRSA